MEFFDLMDPALKTLWFIAIPTSIIFIIQTIMTFMGADGSDGVHADFDGNLHADEAPFQLFSLRNLITFLLGFSWTGISFYALITNRILLITLSLSVGALFVFMFFFVMKQIQKLAEDNSFNIQNTLHKTAEVYLSIPAQKNGKGKIMISINGAFHELSAITENDKIETGSIVKVVKVESGNLLIVEKL